MHPSFQSTLAGELILMRPLTASDREALFLAASDPLIWEQHPQKDRHERTIFDHYFDALLGFDGPLVALEANSKKVIGTSSFYEYSEQTNSVSIGYTFLARQYWGHTYNREMKSLMLEHAFKLVPTVYFHVGETNLRSQAAINKIGAVKCGEEIRTTPSGTKVRALIFKIER